MPDQVHQGRVQTSWSTVNNVRANIDTMLLLTDGSVMAHVLASPSWYRHQTAVEDDIFRGMMKRV